LGEHHGFSSRRGFNLNRKENIEEKTKENKRNTKEKIREYPLFGRYSLV
jgi:hypothetical protein